MKYDVCPICGSPCTIKENVERDIKGFNCFRCGIFKITEEAETCLANVTNNEIRVNISGWIRENKDMEILLTEKKIKSLTQLKNLSVFEKADKILIYLSQKYPIPGVGFRLNINGTNNYFMNINNYFGKDISEQAVSDCKKILPLISIGRILDYFEFHFIWDSFLKKEKQYIQSDYDSFTPKGWAYLESLRQPNPNSRKAFVAMWFTDEMYDIFDNYIETTVIEAGFDKPIYVGKREHNNNINDEIIAEINSSRFIIADFTGNRGGVYYEAGYARGIRIPVIYTCKENWFNKYVKQSIKIKKKSKSEIDKEVSMFSQIHFDVNHQNFIIWKTGEELKEKLINRIKATII